jgi:Zn-dependent protease with chaperone function
MSALVYASTFVAGALLVVFLNHIGLRAFRRSRAEHWTERARVLYPARVAAMTYIPFLPIIVVGLRHMLWPDMAASFVIECVSAWCGVLLGTWFFDRAVISWLTWSIWWQEAALGWGIQFGRLAVYIGAISLIELPLDWRDAATVAAVILFDLWLVFGGLLRLFRIMGMVPDAPAHVRAIVEEVSQRMKVPMPAVWACPSSSCNAVALLWMRTLLFTNILIERLTDAELRGIVAHELAHLDEARSTRLLRVAGLFGIWPCLFIRPLGGLIGSNTLVVLLAWWWLVRRLMEKLAARMEVRADRMAVEMDDAQKAAYAAALAKIYEVGLMPAVMPGGGQVHPHLYARMLSAGVTPEFPRPRPAAKYSILTILVNVAFAVTLITPLDSIIHPILKWLQVR